MKRSILAAILMASAMTVSTVILAAVDTYSGKTYQTAMPGTHLSASLAYTNTIDTGAIVGRATLVTALKTDNAADAVTTVAYSVGTNTVGVFTAVPESVIATLCKTNYAGTIAVQITPSRMANRFLRTVVTTGATVTNGIVASVLVGE